MARNQGRIPRVPAGSIRRREASRRTAPQFELLELAVAGGPDLQAVHSGRGEGAISTVNLPLEATYLDGRCRQSNEGALFIIVHHDGIAGGRE